MLVNNPEIHEIWLMFFFQRGWLHHRLEPWEIDINQTSHGLTGCKLTVSLQHVPCVPKNYISKTSTGTLKKHQNEATQLWPPRSLSEISSPKMEFASFLSSEFRSLYVILYHRHQKSNNATFSQVHRVPKQHIQQGFFLEKIKAHDGSMVLSSIFTYIDPIKSNHSCIGKYTVSPMDPSWVSGWQPRTETPLGLAPC